MIDWLLIGILVGVVLGLTGSGGGIVSIPLFIHLAGTELKAATLFSLVAVFIGSLFNWISQKKNTAYLSSLGIFLFSLFSSFALARLKPTIPDFLIGSALIVVCLFSLYSFWKGKKDSPHKESHALMGFPYSARIALTGLLLGGLTTLTGLGGGVILVPLLLAFLDLSLSQAIATSLLTILLASLGSLWFQRHFIPYEISPWELTALILGVLISTFLVKFLVKRLPEAKLGVTRKILFTLVVMGAVIGVLLRINT